MKAFAGITALFLLLLTLCIGQTIIHAPPPVDIRQAIDIASTHVRTHDIEVSKHYLGSARFVRDSKGDRWIVTWKLIVPSDGGDVFVSVYMDKTASYIGGR